MSNYNYIDLANDYAGKRITTEERERAAKHAELDKELEKIAIQKDRILQALKQCQEVAPLTEDLVKKAFKETMKLELQEKGIAYQKKVLDSGLHEADYRQREIIKDYNGYTGANREAAGYVFPDGKIANIQAPSYKRISFDVNEISKLQNYFEPGTDAAQNPNIALRTFLEEGNIAINPNTGEMYIHENHVMTDKQREIIDNMIDKVATLIEVRVYSSDIAQEPKMLTYEGKSLDINKIEQDLSQHRHENAHKKNKGIGLGDE